ncbi:hypothetical protein [Sphingobacterium thalpophilum]|uniref:hypothetical protein n=1 Tax=Sphingobacterium thalpophilum TaxID=259 RepID=UPI0024A74978|nr:hypothetical protein [Sphingobacterium thalpophilum]
MRIIEKSVKESAKDILMRLKVDNHALEADLTKKNYLRNVITKIQKEYPAMRFTTKTTDKKIYVWRVNPKGSKKNLK